MAGKIYTKTGDRGSTALFGGTRLPKHHMRIEAYGTVDELNSWAGMVRDQSDDETVREQLTDIQHQLFVTGSLLASGEEPGPYIPGLEEDSVRNLEQWMDNMEKKLAPLKNFILPGGHPHISAIHITRCVCRRAERRLTALAENEKVDSILIVYLNRLSDYFFMLARYEAIRKGVDEIPWIAERGRKR